MLLATREQSFIRLVNFVPGPFAYFSVMKSMWQNDNKKNIQQQVKGKSYWRTQDWCLSPFLCHHKKHSLNFLRWAKNCQAYEKSSWVQCTLPKKTILRKSSISDTPCLDKCFFSPFPPMKWVFFVISLVDSLYKNELLSLAACYCFPMFLSDCNIATLVL